MSLLLHLITLRVRGVGCHDNYGRYFDIFRHEASSENFDEAGASIR